MKKLTLLSFILLFFIHFSEAQKASVTVKFVNAKNKDYSYYDKAVLLSFNFLKRNVEDLQLNANNTDTQIFNIKEPKFVTLSYRDKKSRAFSYFLYLSPGDNLLINADLKQPDYGIKVTGKGANNNQPLIALDTNAYDYQKLYGDPLPYRIINALKEREIIRKNRFDKYLQTYKPSPDFVKNWEMNQKYFVPAEFFDFKENNKFKIKIDIGFKRWEKIQDSLFLAEKLNNDNAIISPNYLELLSNFLGREKERLWDLRYKNASVFFKEWYNADIKNGEILFNDDRSNLLQEKIINRYFTGKTANYLYAVLMEDMLEEADHKNINSIFENYKKRFPKSEFIALFKPYVEEITKKLKLPLTDKMVFLPNNGSKLNTFEELLALNKGKTILLDMWGTWCGPCRQEIQKNGPAIKAYFKDKGLDYLYVANYDLTNEKSWKELIAYYKMEGTHILANNGLNTDIMKKVKGTGYPTYVIIKKNGSFELSKAGFPMDRTILIKQIEEALGL